MTHRLRCILLAVVALLAFTAAGLTFRAALAPHYGRPAPGHVAPGYQIGDALYRPGLHRPIRPV